MSTALQQRPFTVNEYHQMGRAGIFSEDDRLELIEGAIVTMPPIGPPHAGTVNRMNRLLVSKFGDEAIITVQNPVRLNTYSEPQPDFAVLHPREDFYTTAHPQPKDVLLVVEVADASLEKDRLIKAGLYAKTGIAEYWLIDLNARVVEVYREPTAEGYRSVAQFGAVDVIRTQALPGVAIAVSEMI